MEKVFTLAGLPPIDTQPLSAGDMQQRPALRCDDQMKTHIPRDVVWQQRFRSLISTSSSLRRGTPPWMRHSERSCTHFTSHTTCGCSTCLTATLSGRSACSEMQSEHIKTHTVQIDSCESITMKLLKCAQGVLATQLVRVIMEHGLHAFESQLLLAHHVTRACSHDTSSLDSAAISLSSTSTGSAVNTIDEASTTARRTAASAWNRTSRRKLGRDQSERSNTGVV